MKRFIAFGLIFSIPLCVGYVAQAHTSENEASSPRNIQKTTIGVCSRIDTLITAQAARFSAKESVVQTKRSSMTSTLTDRAVSADRKLDEHRQKWDSNREEQYAALRARATTDAQRAAIETFITSIQQAIIVRRAAIDDAIAAYRETMTNIASARKTAVDAATAVYKEAISEALQHAKDHCTEGERAASIKSDLTETLNIAKAALESARKGAGSVDSAAKAALTARQDAVSAAWEVFNDTVEQAKTTLKEAFTPVQ